MNLTFRMKMLLLSVVPIVVISSGVLLYVSAEANKTKERNLDALERTLIEEKRTGLKERVQLAISSIEGFLDDNSLDEEDAKTRAKHILSTLRYGDSRDGYFSVYADNATIIMHPIKPELIGRDFSQIKDSNGVFLVPAMIESARSKDGFVRYMWDKPSLKREVQKLAFAKRIPEWSWTIMTGIYIDDVETIVAEKRELADAAMQQQIIGIVLICAIAMAVTIVLCFFAVVHAVKPLNNVVDALTEISHGEGDLTKRLDVKTNDEIGKLANEFNLFASSIQILVCSVADNAEGIGRSSADLKDATQRTSDRIDQQEQETHIVVTAVTQMNQTSIEIAGRTADAAAAAKQASEDAIAGHDVIDSVIAVIKELADNIQNTTTLVERLKSESQEIANITSMISGIAAQTNLLALNASIEAARAGEQGRGFAVVADEVRSLANQTHESTENIRQMITSLQNETEIAFGSMALIRDSSSLSIEKMSTANESFSAIARSVDSISDMNTQVAVALEQQTSVTDEVARNMVRISEITEESSGESKNIADASQGLSDSGERLVSLVHKFKI
ncbi:MAG: cache domain-containing protein [Agarilytica sp.]